MDIIAALGWLGVAWCVINLLWGILRGHALQAAIYGIALFAGVIVTLNIGGVLNAESWNLFTIVVFTGELIFRLWKGPFWRVPLVGILLALALAAAIL